MARSWNAPGTVLARSWNAPSAVLERSWHVAGTPPRRLATPLTADGLAQDLWAPSDTRKCAAFARSDKLALVSSVLKSRARPETTVVIANCVPRSTTRTRTLQAEAFRPQFRPRQHPSSALPRFAALNVACVDLSAPFDARTSCFARKDSLTKLGWY